MKRVHAGAIARGLERLVDPGTVAGLSERQVLARFVERRDPVAFEAIVLRYGPMVLSVCRQMLRDANDVDDAFQATFVILIEKAGGLKQPERLGPWLYGVAHRVASRARRRRRAERLPRDLEGPAGSQDPLEVERLALLHDEIQRLPEKYRLPIVLCCIEEETHDEAARKLNWPIGTVHGRLSRGRELLRGRLGRRGILIPEMVSREAERPSKRPEKAVPESLLRSTVALSTGAVPSQLQTLVKGVVSAMFIEKLKTAALFVVLATIGATAASTALLAYQSREGKPAAPAAVGSAERTLPKKADMRKASGRASDPFVGAEIQKAGGNQVSPLDDGEAESKKAALEVGEMGANLELLELQCEALRSRIQNGLLALHEIEDSLQVAQTGPTSKQQVQKIKTLDEERDTMQQNIETWQEKYQRRRVEIAGLKHQIARAPKPLAEGVDPMEPLAEVIRRIDRLEARVDQIINSIAKGKAR